MALDNLQIDYLIDPAFQIENLAGKPAVGGHCEVFEAGTDTKVITYQDFDGNVNPFKIPLHSDGRAVILADTSRKYDLYVYDSFNNLMFSRLNVTPNLSGNISITGSDVVIYNTDGTLDITQQSIQNNIRRYEINTKHKSFGVQEPLYFVEDSDSATIIGFSGDDYATKDYVNSALSSKLDITAYSSQSGNFLTDKFEYDANNHITAYNHSAFAAGAGSGTIYEAGDHIDITNSVISVTGLPDSADIENAISSAVTNIENKFEYNENNYITAYNNSAFAGTNYSAGDYVSIENDTISVTGLQPSGDYATKTELSGKQDTLSAGDGISIVNNIISVTSQGGGIEQVNHDDTLSGNGNDEPLGVANIEDFVKQNDLTAYQEKGDYYSASNPSGFITNDAITGLQPSGDYVTRDELTAYQPSGNYATIEDVESAVSGKQDILSAGEGIQIINNTISVTAQGGGGITVVNHDNTLSGNGNSEPLGLANAEDYVKQDDLTGYATTALVSSVSSELYSAFSGISGDYVLVAGSGVELVDDPNAKTTTISVTAQGSNTISYSAKPTADPIYADKNDLKNVDSIQGKSNLAIVPNGVLQVPNVITAAPNSVLNVPGVIVASPAGINANGLTANNNGLFANWLSADTNGLFANGLSVDAAHSSFSSMGISAGKQGPLCIEGKYEIIRANGSGFTFSSQNTAFGTAQLTTDYGAPKFEAKNVSGAGFSIEASGAKGYDESGNVVWDTNNPQVKNIISYGDTKTAAGGLNGNIILTPMPSTNASNLTSSPYVIMDAEQASYFAAYGPSAQTPTIKLKPDAITFDYAAGNAKTTVGYNDVKQELSGSSWTLTGSIQKRELEYDANISAITSIAGSAICGGGGELPESVSAATDYVTANSANIYATVSNVSANSGVWGGSALPISAGPGINVNLVDNTLVFSNDETVLWSGDAGTGTNLVLSENYTNFDRLRFEYRPWSTAETPSHQISEVGTTYNNFTLGSFWNNDTTFATFIYTYQGNGTNQLNFIRGAYNNGNSWTTADNINMFKVVGINRIAGGN